MTARAPWERTRGRFRGHAIVRWIVGRCHVGDSNLAVIRYAVGRLAGGRAGFLRLSRSDRRSYLAECVRAHGGGRREYNAVMGSRR